MLAVGNVCDAMPGADPDDDHPCDCYVASLAAAVDALGLECPPAEALTDWLKRMSTSRRVLEFKHRQHAPAGRIVANALSSGLLDRQAARLHDEGRITIDPAEVAAALNTSGRSATPIH